MSVNTVVVFVSVLERGRLEEEEEEEEEEEVLGGQGAGHRPCSYRHRIGGLT